MVINTESEYYPLQTRVGTMDGETYYDRSRRGKSWFLLDLALTGPIFFIPKGASGLITAEGEALQTKTRRK